MADLAQKLTHFGTNCDQVHEKLESAIKGNKVQNNEKILILLFFIETSFSSDSNANFEQLLSLGHQTNQKLETANNGNVHNWKIFLFFNFSDCNFKNSFSDLNQKLAAVVSSNQQAIVPVFSASKAVQCAAGNRVTFKQLNFETDESHGSFNKSTGVFTVNKDGIYLFNFNGTGYSRGYSQINLRVNDVVNASSFFEHGESHFHYGSLAVSPVLELSRGDKVDVFVQFGSLSDGKSGVYSSFSAIFLSESSYWKDLSEKTLVLKHRNDLSILFCNNFQMKNYTFELYCHVCIGEKYVFLLF